MALSQISEYGKGVPTMKTGKMIFFAVLGTMALLAVEAKEKPQDQDFNGSAYQCKIFSRRVKDSGFMNLKAGGKTLIRSNRIYGSCKGGDDQNTALMEQPSAEYKWENNVLTNKRFLFPRKAQSNDAEKYAKISRRIAFGPDKITVEITVTALRDIRFSNTWQTFNEIIGIVTDSVKGMRIEGILPDDQVISSVIPQKYDRRKWGFRKNVKQFKMTDSEKLNMVVTAAADCKLLLNHYGGRSIELVISPDIKTADLQLKAGTEIKIGYTIEFKKPE